MTIKCLKCGRSPPSQKEIELSDGHWLCQECISLQYSLHLLDFIKTRISVTRTEDEDRSKFVLRELVQNADDAFASMLVLRFEEDALYVANDGRAFSTVGPKGEPGDWDRAAQVLRRFKADEKESAGHFGSGFQTVYAITNSPEVHSNGISRALKPARMSWENLPEHRYSPYMGGVEGRKGVLFRLPWRDDKAAEATDVGDDRPFADSNFWPRWDARAIRGFYDDLKDYLHAVLLCCQRLRSIRIIWAVSDKVEAYEASRDFQLDEPLKGPTVVNVSEGLASEAMSWYEWDKGVTECPTCPSSFNADFSSYENVRSFLAASDRVADENGHLLFMIKEEKGAVRVVNKILSTTKEIKKNNVHMLLPLFPAGRSFLYSVIPLPSRGNNQFAFSAHLIPTEDRKDVDLQGNSEMNKAWYRACLLTTARLYRSIFPPFLARVENLKLPVLEKQRLVLQALPTDEIGEWMRPRRRDIDWAHEQTESLWGWIFSKPILVTSDNRWNSPQDAYLASTESERNVLETLGLVPYPAEFVSLCSKIEWLKNRAEKHKFLPQVLVQIWKQIVESNKANAFRYRGSVLLAPGRRLVLDSETLQAIARYALGNEETASMQLIPDAEGVLHDIRSFPKLPKGFQALESLLPRSSRIHSDFAKVIPQLETRQARRDEVRVADLPELISDAVGQQATRFHVVSRQDHRLTSEMVVRIVQDDTFAQTKARDKNFLPYRIGDAIGIGPPPETVVDAVHAGENYHRDWIFATQRVPVPGMSKELEARIRFLDLEGVAAKDVKVVEEKLNLVALAELKDQPTNFVRHFVSARHGSLFEDDSLASFLGVHTTSLLEKQKKILLLALKAYFDGKKTERFLTPGEMGQIPCLYDGKGNWQKAELFALGEAPLLSLLGYKRLHQDFDSWPHETLEGLGVTVDVATTSAVAKKIIDWAEHPARNRAQLLDLLVTVLSTFDITRLRELDRLLSNQSWIPVRGMKVARASEVVFPTDDIVSILGKNHQTYIHFDEKHLESLRQLDQKQMKDKLTALGIRFDLTVREMIDSVTSLSRNRMRPPEKLLEDLSRGLGKLDFTARTQLRGLASACKFYWNERWYDGNKIRVLERRVDFPVSFETIGILVLSKEEAGPFKLYLEFIDAHGQLVVEDFLRGLQYVVQQAERTPARMLEFAKVHDALWIGLDSLAKDISPEMRVEFEHDRILYVSGTFYAPTDALIDDRGIFDKVVSFGKTCILPMNVCHTALNKLGATKITELTANKAQAFLRESATDGSITNELSEAYIKLILMGIERRWWRRDIPLLWPASSRHELRFGRPNICYVANSAVVNTFDAVPTLVTSTSDGPRLELESLAREWGAHNLSSEVSFPNLDMTGQNHAQDIETLLLEVYPTLSRIFKIDWNNLSWIRSLEVILTKDHPQAYSVGQYRGRFPIPAVVPLGSNRVGLLIRQDEATFGQSGADRIAEWSVGEGFPVSKQMEFARVLFELYSKAREETAGALESRPGYLDTLKMLAGWYVGCQICGWRTPRDEHSGESEETLKSIVSLRGGLRPGTFERYDVGNCLYLCPRHSTLVERRLVRLSLLDGTRSQIADKLRAARPQIIDSGGIPVRVYEWNTRQQEEEGWKTRKLTLLQSHIDALIERLPDFLERNK